MTRLRLAYSQYGPARFLGHLDTMRLFERACRRAGLRLSYTQGFNPHPKISFATPLPVGMNGAQEYVDLELETAPSAEETIAVLGAQLPAGFTIQRVRRIEAPNPPSLMSLLDRAHYRVSGRPVQDRDGRSWTEVRVGEEIERLLSRGDVFVERQTGKGVKKKDIRVGIRSLRGRIGQGELVLLMELAAGGRCNVRPDEVLQALREQGGLELEVIQVWRTALLSREGCLLWEC